MDQKADILMKYFRENKSQRAIARELGISRTTVQKSINDFILKHISVTCSQRAFVLDAGCGEGSHLSRILAAIRNKSNAKLQGVGIDISKGGYIAPLYSPLIDLEKILVSW